MIEKPWYKKWWGVLLIIFGVLTFVNIATQKYVLMSKALAYKIANEGRTLESAKNVGFKKLVFTDGFNNSWTYDLTKPNE